MKDLDLEKILGHAKRGLCFYLGMLGALGLLQKLLSALY